MITLVAALSAVIILARLMIELVIQARIPMLRADHEEHRMEG